MEFERRQEQNENILRRPSRWACSPLLGATGN
jgi:Bacterial signalling protein N terminal repeat